MSRVSDLNDRLRTTFEGGRVVMTAGVNALPYPEQVEIFNAVQKFTNFNEDNDPYKEHDCAVIKMEKHKVIWKIDYYDKNLEYGSEDPSDPTKTTRVLTIMLAEEY